MKARFLLIFGILLSVKGINAQVKTATSYSPLSTNFSHSLFSKISPTDAEWFARATGHIEESGYYFIQKEPGHYAAVNSHNKMRFDIYPDGFIASNLPGNQGDSWKASFNLKSVTRDSHSLEIQNSLSELNKNRLVISHENMDMELINTAAGLRQNFILKEKLQGRGDLSINISLKGTSFRTDDRNRLLCYEENDSKNIKLIYDSLKVWDANNRLLPAHMRVKDGLLSIVIDDRNAVYPVTVDPLNHMPEWTTSADGVLPGLLNNLQLQVDALYGYHVTALGDVNGDGIDDIAIGAPGAIDIISGPATIVGAGAVFIYFGNESGLPVVPSKVLRASTPVANALFGLSIAGGNVSGDARNDIIVGAPGDSYVANVGGAPSTATVTAGKAYIFRGEDLTSSAPSPFLSVYLNGSSFFSRGVLGLVGSNININALFGFSVAVTEDMDGDGLGEIAVGSPGYAGLELLPVRSGAAWIYSSKTLGSNTPVQLTAPTVSLLGIPLANTSGLLFGFSIDGVGDYNLDGHPDVVVGAPAGLTVSLGNLLGGTAYVYYGNGSGVNTSIGTRLSATSSLLNNVANLFGYSVLGIRDASGKRTGGILAGAPSGNLLSNVLGGLTLKTGSVGVFLPHNSPATSEVPTQNILSPRGNSLLSILGGKNIDVSALFGASMDNMLDVNCDGINDIIIGEPLSTAVGIINADAVGGAAHIFLGNKDGTFQNAPYWSLENQVSLDLGINAGSLLGYSVAGARHVRGPLQGVRALVGAPGAALDFGSGLLNLGNTLGTLFNFAAGDNGLGKAYMFGFSDCGVKFYPDINVTYVNKPVPGNVSTNDIVPAATTYGTPVASGSNPSVASVTMFNDGRYTFTAAVPGVYHYNVPVCLPGAASGCTGVDLQITVLSLSAVVNPPVANTDIASTRQGEPVTIHGLENDHCGNIGCVLDPSSVTIVKGPSNGTASVDPLTGNVLYTSSAGFTGTDTLLYRVCDNNSPVQCATASQFIYVYATAHTNTTLAADDYNITLKGMPVTGNVKLNDTDPEGDNQLIATQNINVPNIGNLVLQADGAYSFTPIGTFTGPASFTYTTCDDNTDKACASATLYILVDPSGTLGVNLSDFHAEVKDCGVKLVWTTNQKLNAARFHIENSQDAMDWKEAGMVPANNKVENNSYSFVPSYLQSGQNYYRLVIESKDGSKGYSKIVSPYLSCSNPVLVVQPNPFKDKIAIHYQADQPEPVAITLTDVAGKPVVSASLIATEGGNTVILKNLQKLPQGIYILYVRTRDKVFVQRLLK